MARLDEAERTGCPHALRLAHTSVATCYRAIGALSAGEDSLRHALRAARKAGSNRSIVEVLCELAETACAIAETLHPANAPGARAARDRARDQAFEASALVLRAADTDWAFAALLRVSDVLNRCGDHEDAAVLQSRALEALRRG